MALKLQTIICSTRPGRIGPAIASWFDEYARSEGSFSPRLIDLADFNLPLYDEPHHPRLQKYQHEHTKAWSKSVYEADAYVFVLPEYNHCPPPSFTNALNYVYHEWNYKPCGFVNYGGASGGLRAAELAKQLVTTLKMMPVVGGVTVQTPWKLLDDQKAFVAGEQHDHSAKATLEELAKWAQALRTIRTPGPSGG